MSGTDIHASSVNPSVMKVNFTSGDDCPGFIGVVLWHTDASVHPVLMGFVSMQKNNNDNDNNDQDAILIPHVFPNLKSTDDQFSALVEISPKPGSVRVHLFPILPNGATQYINAMKFYRCEPSVSEINNNNKNQNTPSHFAFNGRVQLRLANNKESRKYTTEMYAVPFAPVSDSSPIYFSYQRLRHIIELNTGGNNAKDEKDEKEEKHTSIHSDAETTQTKTTVRNKDVRDKHKNKNKDHMKNGNLMLTGFILTIVFDDQTQELQLQKPVSGTKFNTISPILSTQYAVPRNQDGSNVYGVVWGVETQVDESMKSDASTRVHASLSHSEQQQQQEQQQQPLAIQPRDKTTTNDHSPQSNHKSWPIIVFGLLLCLAFIATCVCLVVVNCKYPKQNNQSQSQTQSQSQPPKTDDKVVNTVLDSEQHLPENQRMRSQLVPLISSIPSVSVLVPAPRSSVFE